MSRMIKGGLIQCHNPINDNETPVTPEVFALYPNYPNPFNPVTNIKFSIPENQKVYLGIYSVTGRLVETLVNENRIDDYSRDESCFGMRWSENPKDRCLLTLFVGS